ncbi:MAG: YraN family protein [bacterium]|nr:YraN family protein [bacterium]
MSFERKRLGAWGELVSEKYLVDKGYSILARNYRKPWGEVDLVATKNDILVFVEVKTRDSIHAHHFLPEESITPVKKRKLRKVCEIYLAEHKIQPDQQWQIDVLSIILDKSTQKARINHIQNAVWDVR